MKKAERKGMKSHRAALVRASISFPPDLYKSLGELAKRKKVSMAWVVRDASERYVAEETVRAARSQTHARGREISS